MHNHFTQVQQAFMAHIRDPENTISLVMLGRSHGFTEIFFNNVDGFVARIQYLKSLYRAAEDR